MHIRPYISLDDVRFGDDASAVEKALGRPNSQRRNKEGELEYDYGDLVVRLCDRRGVVEFSAQREAVAIHENTVHRTDLAAFLLEHDAGAKEAYGFVISPHFGVAYDPDPDQGGWITVFERGRWDEFI